MGSGPGWLSYWFSSSLLSSTVKTCHVLGTQDPRELRVRQTMPYGHTMVTRVAGGRGSGRMLRFPQQPQGEAFERSSCLRGALALGLKHLHVRPAVSTTFSSMKDISRELFTTSHKPCGGGAPHLTDEGAEAQPDGGSGCRCGHFSSHPLWAEVWRRGKMSLRGLEGQAKASFR